MDNNLPYDYVAPNFWYGLQPQYDLNATAAFREYRPEQNFPGLYSIATPNANSTPNVLRTYTITPRTDFKGSVESLNKLEERERDFLKAWESYTPIQKQLHEIGAYSFPGYGGGATAATPEELKALANNTRRLTGAITENSEAYYGFDAVQENLFNSDNWQNAINSISNVYNDDSIKALPEYKKAIAQIASQGLGKSTIYRDLQKLLPSHASNAQGDEYRTELADYYANLRDDDVRFFANDFQQEISSAGLKRHPDDKHYLPFYGEEAAKREGANYQQAINYAKNIDFGSLFKDISGRLKQNIDNASGKSAVTGGIGRTAYAGDLGSASNYYQHVPDQEFANVFNTSDKPYKGT